MLTATPRLRIVGHGSRLRVRTKGDWPANSVGALRESCRASVAVDKAVAEAINGARVAGLSWPEIGRVLGVDADATDRRALIDASPPAVAPSSTTSFGRHVDEQRDPRRRVHGRAGCRRTGVDLPTVRRDRSPRRSHGSGSMRLRGGLLVQTPGAERLSLGVPIRAPHRPPWTTHGRGLKGTQPTCEGRAVQRLVDGLPSSPSVEAGRGVAPMLTWSDSTTP